MGSPASLLAQQRLANQSPRNASAHAMSFRAKTNSPTDQDVERMNLHTADNPGHNAGETGGDEGPPKPLFKVATGQKQSFGPFKSLAANSTATNTDCLSKLSVKEKEMRRKIQEMGATNSSHRRDTFVQKLKDHPDLLGSIMGGSVDMTHPTQLSWREKSDNANIYVRKYLPSSDRASLSKFMNESALMTQTDYKDKDPNRTHMLRPDQKTKDNKNAPRYTARHELERIQDSIGGQHPVDFESWDLRHFKYPVYKPIQKSLWKTKNGFSVKQTKDGKHVWKQAPVGTEAGTNPYRDGHANVGQEGVERRRNKAKELSKTQEFEGMCAPDNWRNTYSRVNSLHSGHSLEH